MERTGEGQPKPAVISIDLPPSSYDSIPPSRCILCDTPMQRVLTALECRGTTKIVMAANVPTDRCDPCNLDFILIPGSIDFLTSTLTQFSSPEESVIRSQLGQELEAARYHFLRSNPQGLIKHEP